VPNAWRGKGLGNENPQQGLTFSGPAEQGGVQSRGTATASSDEEAAGGSTRRERRAAARTQAKKGKKRR
jgi:preprotein translocase subunit SecA